MQHIAHQADLQSFDLAVLVADRQEIEQRLGGMLVLPVARVDHVGIDAIAEEFGRPGRRMADHDHIDPHRFEVARGVHQRLAFGDG